MMRRPDALWKTFDTYLLTVKGPGVRVPKGMSESFARINKLQ